MPGQARQSRPRFATRPAPPLAPAFLTWHLPGQIRPARQSRTATMPARNGRQYLDGLRAQERLLYMGGERVRDVTTHPGLASGARAVAALYDMQRDPALAAEMTYTS